jgi:hypothetical protein
MQAEVGDRLHIHGHTVGDPDRMGEIVEVRGGAGKPPYLVRFDDGHTRLVFPGPDAVIEQRARTGGGRKSAPGAKAAGRGRGGAASAAAKGAGPKSARAKGSPRKKGGG